MVVVITIINNNIIVVVVVIIKPQAVWQNKHIGEGRA